jgi:hypothetical protein
MTFSAKSNALQALGFNDHFVVLVVAWVLYGDSAGF